MQDRFDGLRAEVRAVCLAFLALASSQAQAGPYWDAFFELAHDPATEQVDRQEALRHIQAIGEFWRAFQLERRIDQDFEKTLAEVRARIANLDVGNLYDALPSQGRATEWRGIGVQGSLVGTSYALTLKDPEIDHWASSPPASRPALWGHGSRFGDLAARIFVLPGDRSTFRFTTENRLHMGQVPPRNVPRVFTRLMQAAEQDARSAKMPPPDFAARYPMPPGSLRIAASYAQDFPELFSTVRRFVKVSKIGEISADGTHLLMDLTLTIDPEAFEETFPAIAELLERLEDMVKLRSLVRDFAGRIISETTFDSSEMTLNVRFATHEGRILPCDETWRPLPAPAISLTDPGDLDLTNHVDLHLNVNGLHLDLRGLDSRIRYSMSQSGPLIHAVYDHPPRQVAASGFVMGFIPLWMIDLFIPSNIEDITRDFLTTMARGNGGAGSIIRVGTLDAPRMERDVWLLTDSEVLGNGMIRFALDMQRHIAGSNEDLEEDLRKLKQLLLDAFKRDLVKIMN